MLKELAPRPSALHYSIIVGPRGTERVLARSDYKVDVAEVFPLPRPARPRQYVAWLNEDYGDRHKIRDESLDFLIASIVS
jgi:hypothetical protein